MLLLAKKKKEEEEQEITENATAKPGKAPGRARPVVSLFLSHRAGRQYIIRGTASIWHGRQHGRGRRFSYHRRGGVEPEVVEKSRKNRAEQEKLFTQNDEGRRL